MHKPTEWAFPTVPVKALEATFALFWMGKFCWTAMKMAWLVFLFCCFQSSLHDKCKHSIASNAFTETVSSGRWFWKNDLLRTLRIFLDRGPFRVESSFWQCILTFLYFYWLLGQTIQIDWKCFHQSSSSETLDLVVSMLFHLWSMVKCLLMDVTLSVINVKP